MIKDKCFICGHPLLFELPEDCPDNVVCGREECIVEGMKREEEREPDWIERIVGKKSDEESILSGYLKKGNKWKKF